MAAKKLLLILLLILIASVVFTHPTMGAPQVNQTTTPQSLYFFYYNGCSSCEEAKAFMLNVSQDFPVLTVHDFELHNSSNYDLMVQYYNYHNITTYIYPVIFIGNQVLMGVSQIESNVEPLLLNGTGVVQNATLVLQSSIANVNPGQTVTLSGTITPSALGNVTLSQSVNGSAFHQIATVALANGTYSYPYVISGAGTYKFQTSFEGNSQLNPAQSSAVAVSSAQAPDYTWYIVGGVLILVIIVLATYYMIAMRSRTKPAK